MKITSQEWAVRAAAKAAKKAEAAAERARRAADQSRIALFKDEGYLSKLKTSRCA